MPTFLSRRYARRIEQVGTVERVVGVVLLLLTAGIVAAFVLQVATDETRLFDVDEAAYSVMLPSAAKTPPQADYSAGTVAAASNPFPDSNAKGWRRPTRVFHYPPENLYMKIDGRAPVYIEAGVVALTFGTYSHQADSSRTVDVYWYDMGGASNASRIFEAEAAPGATHPAIGNNSYQIGGAVFFWKGTAYVQVLPSGLDATDAQAALAIARQIAERIENDTGGS